MISVDRFIVSSQTRDLWLVERARGVTATQVAKAATPAGFEAAIAAMTEPETIVPNAMMQHGIDREAHIAHVVKENYGVMPNDWLLCHEVERWQLATPDGLSLDHELIAEYKTSGKPLDKIPMHYMRQVQWQLHVSGAAACIFAYELRHETPYGFVPGFDVKTQIVERNNKMIAELVSVAERLQEHAVMLEQATELAHQPLQ